MSRRGGHLGARPRTGAIALAVGVLAGLSAEPAPAGQRLNLGVSLTSAYDSNILEYSDQQISLFEKGTRPDRYSLQSTDDLIWNPLLSLAWEQVGARGRRHALRLKAEGDFHQKNGTADFRSASAGWRESWSQGRRLTLSGYRLPDFYLRQLADEDYVPPFPGLSSYRRATFRLDILSLEWAQQVGRSNSVAIETQREIRHYHRDFRERDSDTDQERVAWGWTRLPNRAQIELRGLYRLSNAKAEDGDELAGVPDDADLSYSGFAGGVHGESDLAAQERSRWIGDVDYQLSTRHYDSNRSFDKYHFGRRDLLHTLELGVSFRWKRDLRARAFWHLDRNAAKLGSSAPATTEAGDYTRYQLGLRLDWSRTLWRTRATTPAGEE